MNSPFPDDATRAQLYAKLIAYGRDKVEFLQSFYGGRCDASHTANGCRTSTALQRLYNAQHGDLRRMDKGAQGVLKEWNVNTEAPLRYKYVEVQNGGGIDTIYLNHFSAIDGVIVHVENFVHNDTNPPGRRLFPSEAVWESFVLTAKLQEANLSNLRLLVRASVENPDTRAMIWQAASHSTYTKGPEQGQPDNGYREYTEGDDGFYAILGAPNGAMSMRMLHDHKRELGYRTLERVIVAGFPKAELTEEWVQSRVLLFVLSDKRTLPPPNPLKRAYDQFLQ